MANIRQTFELTAVDRTRAAFQSAQSNLSRLDRTVKQFAGGLGAGIGLAAVTTVVDRVTSDAQSLSQALDNFDFRLDDWQRFKIAADQAGVGIKQLETAFQRMARRVSQAADGTGEAQDALRELNLDAEKLEQLSIADQFDAITRAVEPLAKPDKIRLLQKIFDSEGVKAVLDTTRAVDELGSSFDDLLLKQSQLENLLFAKEWLDNISSEIKLLTSGAIADFVGQMRKILELSKSLDVSVTKILQKIPGLGGIGDTLGVEELEIVNADLAKTEKALGGLLDRASRLAERGITGGFAFEFNNRSLETTKDRYDALLERRNALLRQAEQAKRSPGGRPDEIFGAGFYGPAGPGDVNLDSPTTIRISGTRRGTGDLGFNRANQIALNRRDEAAHDAVLMREELEALAVTFDVTTDKMQDNFRAVAEQQRQFAEETREVNRAADQLGFTFTSAFEDAVIAGGKLSEVLESLLADIARIVLRLTVTQPLAQGLSGLFQNAFTASPGIGVLGSGAFATRASGGPLSPGQLARVGENGPELFVPKSYGNVIPNGAFGGESVNINFNVQAIDAQSFQGALASNERLITGMVRKGFAKRGNRVDL